MSSCLQSLLDFQRASFGQKAILDLSIREASLREAPLECGALHRLSITYATVQEAFTFIEGGAEHRTPKALRARTLRVFKDFCNYPLRGYNQKPFGEPV